MRNGQQSWSAHGLGLSDLTPFIDLELTRQDSIGCEL